MRGRTSNIKIELTPESRDVLLGWLRRQKNPQGLAKRARAILLLGDGLSFTQTSLQVGMGERHLRKQDDLLNEALGLYDKRPGRVPVFPLVALYLVKIACERPDTIGRSLSQWDCTELARQLVAAGVVDSISASTIRRILQSHQLAMAASPVVIA